MLNFQDNSWRFQKLFILLQPNPFDEEKHDIYFLIIHQLILKNHYQYD